MPKRLTGGAGIIVAAILLLPASLQAGKDGPSIYLIRHAEKAKSPAGDPGLTAAGRARAECWARQLSDRGIEAVYATETRRAWQTAEPIAAALDVAVRPYDPYALDALAAELRDGPDAVVVGHSNTTPELAKALGGDAGAPITEGEYGRLYHVGRRGASIEFGVCDP